MKFLTRPTAGRMPTQWKRRKKRLTRKMARKTIKKMTKKLRKMIRRKHLDRESIIITTLTFLKTMYSLTFIIMSKTICLQVMNILEWNMLLSHKDGKTFMLMPMLKLTVKKMKNQRISQKEKWILSYTISLLTTYHH